MAQADAMAKTVLMTDGVEEKGFEPSTPGLQSRCSTN